METTLPLPKYIAKTNRIMRTDIRKTISLEKIARTLPYLDIREDVARGVFIAILYVGRSACTTRLYTPLLYRPSFLRDSIVFLASLDSFLGKRTLTFTKMSPLPPLLCGTPLPFILKTSP